MKPEHLDVVEELAAALGEHLALRRSLSAYHRDTRSEQAEALPPWA